NVAESLALKTVQLLNSPGIFAVELFLDADNQVSVNEIAPRVHNSGHHTIEGNFCSQFHMLWRIILKYPLGNPKTIMPSLLINIIGAEGYTGNALYEGIKDVLKLENTYVHIYGKNETKPGRKMGHINILDHNKTSLIDKADVVKKHIIVKS
ncbi:MAG: ATP-grasp domain-containing protein, partial [Ferruginibacter sp.]